MARKRTVSRASEAIEQWSVADLAPYAGNARTHPPEQIDRLAASITEFGFTIPVLVAEDGTIIAGHGRVLAARKLGLEAVPVIVATGWSDEKRRAYTIADNRLAEISGWDDATLRAELQALVDANATSEGIGFSEDELTKLLDVEAGLADGFQDRQASLNEATRIRIGAYSFVVENDLLKELLDDIRQEVGDTKPAIIEALKARLGLK